MTFNVLNKLLDDSQLSNFIYNVSMGKFESPYLMNKIVELLNDSSPLLNMIPDSDKLDFARLTKSYFDSCWGVFIENIRLDNLVKAGKMEIYKVEAPNGIRYATVNEIAQGVIGLMSDFVYPVGIENYKKLALLQWTFSGNSYYFKEAGYKLTYDKDGKVEETFLELINESINELKELVKWVDTPEFEKSVDLIKKLKNKDFKYASYEKDEIEETISIKQLVYNIDKTFPRSSNDIDYRRAIALVIKGKKNFKSLTPMEISFLRRAYLKKALDRTKENKVDEQLKTDCEHLLAVRYSGKIDQNHFVYKIITTLKGKNFEYCSDKQRDIINSALKLLEKEDNKENNVNDIAPIRNIMDEDDIDKELERFSGESIVDISEAIGQGLLFEDEEGY